MRTVLVLDDEVDLAEAVATSLAENGFKSEYCTTVDDALQMFANKKYDLIISDI